MAPLKRPRGYKISGGKKRRSEGAVTKLSVPRGVFAFPDSLWTTVRYFDNITLTSSTGAVAKQVLRANSIFDPDFTGTGHQPLYHDQLQAIYNRYYVKSSTIKVTYSIVPNAIATSQPSGPMVVGLLGDESASTSTTLTTLQENNTSKSCVLNRDSNATETLTLYYSSKRDTGFGENDDVVTAAFGGNPSQQYYITLFAAETGLATASSVIATIEMIFYIKCFRSIDVAQS